MWHACGLASLLEQKTKEVRDFLFLRRGWKLLREIEGKLGKKLEIDKEEEGDGIE